MAAGVMDPMPSHLYGLVDMGSNGIRFSITDLSPNTARSLPTLFQERLGTSLYDAQYRSGTRGPMTQDIIDEVLSSLRRFRAVCADFQVPETNIQILATEATRTAPNSEDYRKQIKDATGWEVNLLPKEIEGRIGALGVASSFDTVQGLVMDLGGGSTQITWMISERGHVNTSPKGSFSFPYGAAALSRMLSDFKTQKDSDDLKAKMKADFLEAFSNLELPDLLRQQAKSQGLTLYLSGGGFRGWGYLLMNTHRTNPYPIPIINGFSVSVKEFSKTDAISILAEDHANIFRVSKRRAAQIPAVAFLVNVLIEALPFISDVRFCQGGVREGYLFDTLSPEIRSFDPLTSATSRYTKCPTSATHIATLLSSSFPGTNALWRSVPTSISNPTLLRAVSNTMYVQASSIKESASTAALYLPITGVLSSAHGVSHTDRALLSLILCERWQGELPPPHDNLQSRLQSLLTNQEVWWCNYLGAVANLIGVVYPSGKIPQSSTSTTSPSKPRLSLSSKWAEGLGKKGNMQGVILTISIDRSQAAILGCHIDVKGEDDDDDSNRKGRERLREEIDRIEDVGKKKNRIGGKEYGFGVPIRVDLEWM